ncbi:MAG: hypothetical protein K2I82_04165 [Ruminococcus sp.]|nr:hypothetical protein [Ruminococcus sp.]
MIGLVKILIFFTVLLLFFWGLNIYKHICSDWTKFQKVTDTVGAVMLLGFLISLIIPLMK